jgi:hypothetical protein
MTKWVKTNKEASCLLHNTTFNYCGIGLIRKHVFNRKISADLEVSLGKWIASIFYPASLSAHTLPAAQFTLIFTKRLYYVLCRGIGFIMGGFVIRPSGWQRSSPVA